MKVFNCERAQVLIWIRARKSFQATLGFCKNGHRSVSVYPSEGARLWIGMTAGSKPLGTPRLKTNDFSENQRPRQTRRSGFGQEEDCEGGLISEMG